MKHLVKMKHIIRKFRETNPALTPALLFLFFFLQSCSGSPDDPVDPKEMRDETGLRIDLEWSSGGSMAQALADVDLDLELLKGTTSVESSYSFYSFEQVEVKDIYTDGEYIVQISVDHVAKNSSYTVYFTGIKSGTVKQYEGTVSTSEDGSKIEFIRITKQGTKYILSR